jgi:tetratricopeptide (TPR) repeat protein
MSTSIHLRRLLGGAACVLALSACSTAPTIKTPVAVPTIADVMGKAAAADSAGQKEAAMTLWKQAAVAYPADKDPWTRMAQTKYDAGQYGEAIVNAQEILVRDPNDQLANSIIAISGLRLSTRALADLSRQNNLNGSVRTESKDLAKLLRESLGEEVLVPTARDRGVQPPPRNNGVVNKKGGGKQPARETKADPFDALK